MPQSARQNAAQMFGGLQLADDAFDRLAAVAATICQQPNALVALIDDGRLHIIAQAGRVSHDAPTEAIARDPPWIISDVELDPVTHPMPGRSDLRSCFGMPIVTADKIPIGVLAVFDHVPRSLSRAELLMLEQLAAVAGALLEHKRRVADGRSEVLAHLARHEIREDHIAGLRREVVHRTKNLLAVVQAMARHSMPAEGDGRAHAEKLAGRIQGLAATYELITDMEWRGVPLAELAKRQLHLASNGAFGRTQLQGPHILLTSSAAQHIGLALHELAANAREHVGAMPAEVSFTWRMVESIPREPWLRAIWRETRRPSPLQPPRTGFGHLVLERLVPEGLGGTGRLAWEPSGVYWTLEVPASRAVAA